MLQPIYILSLLPVPVLGVIAAVMYRRKQHRPYPIFWSYVCFEFCATTIELATSPTAPNAFFYVYWIASFARIVFILLLLRAIFVRVLRNHVPLAKIRQRGYEAILAVIWVAGVLVAFRSGSSHTIFSLITRSEQAVSFTAVGMFIFVVITSLIFGIHWKNPTCGIALGLGVRGTVDLLVFTALTGHWIGRMQASWAETISFDVAVGIFALYFLPLKREPAVPLALHTDVYEWAQEARKAVS